MPLCYHFEKERRRKEQVSRPIRKAGKPPICSFLFRCGTPTLHLKRKSTDVLGTLPAPQQCATTQPVPPGSERCQSLGLAHFLGIIPVVRESGLECLLTVSHWVRERMFTARERWSTPSGFSFFIIIHFYANKDLNKPQSLSLFRFPKMQNKFDVMQIIFLEEDYCWSRPILQSNFSMLQICSTLEVLWKTR